MRLFGLHPHCGQECPRSAGAGTLSVKANTGTVPATPAMNPATTLQRYWSLNGSGITADVTFNYLQGDVAGNEANYRILRVAGGVRSSFGNVPPCPGAGPVCVNTTANTLFMANLSTFSDWSASELAPTAAPVGINGRVLGWEGRGEPMAVVALTDQFGNVVYAKTNSFGYFRFTGVTTGASYVIAVDSKRFRYTPQVVEGNDTVTGITFAPEP